MNASDVETAILKVTATTPSDDIAATLEKLAAYLERGKELKELLESRLKEIIEETGHDIEVGTVRYYVGDKRTTKCRDAGEAVRSLLETLGAEGLAPLLASQPLRYGACKQVLPADEYDRLFEVVVERELKEGKPLKRLQKIDTRFIR